MKLLRINKYILKTIFNHLIFENELNFLRYNRKLQSKLDISLYTYQKKYFEKIITPTLLKNTEILLQKNIYDKKTLNKLKSEWDNDTTEAIQEKDCFHFSKKMNTKNLKDIKILNVTLKNKNLLEKNTPNLIELNISNVKNLELPCSILLNLESLSLKDISKLKFLNKGDNISLNKLRHLYLNNISFNEENKIKISLNNLKYLDLRLKEQDGDPEDSGFKNDDNKAGFNKENTLQYLINIFDFQFLSLFKREKSERVAMPQVGVMDMLSDNEEEFIVDIFYDLVVAYKKPKELFDSKYLSKYDFFNFEILFEYFAISGSAYFAERFIYKYLFAKTKGNKYIFKTEYTNYELINDEGEMETFNKEIRYCNNKNYNDYYFINNEYEIGGSDFVERFLKYEAINSYSIIPKYNIYSYELIKKLEKFKKNNNQLEILTIEYVDLSITKSFLDNLNRLEKLKCFYITKNLKFKNNKQLIDLFATLSKIKSLFLIDITLQKKLKLNSNEEKKINKNFPGISFKTAKNESSIKWYNCDYSIISNKKV